MRPSAALPVAIAVGVAGAVAVVLIQSVAADAIGGAVAVAALIAVVSAAFRMAADGS